MDSDNDNEKDDKENDENERDNQVYSDSKSYDDIQFKESYNEVIYSHINSINKIYDGKD